MSEPAESRVSRSPSTSTSANQSLFNIYYLGQTKVDRRCNAAMMPWIIEELKLKADEMKFIWLAPGPEEVSFVADNGLELFNHSYGNILHCCIAVDGISFAYAARQEKDKYFCHVFQALTYEEAAKIMTEFKVHSHGEVAVPPTITHNSSSYPSLPADGKSSGYIMSSLNGSLPREEEYKLEYWGQHQVPPLSSGNTHQVQIIDNLVSKFREVMSNSGTFHSKFRTKKKSFGSRFKTKTSTPKLESVDSDLSAGSVDSLGETGRQAVASTSSLDRCILTPASDESCTQLEPFSASLEDPADFHSSCHQNTFSMADGRSRTESSDFDTIPELANLKSSTEFQALSQDGGNGGEMMVKNQKVRLIFTGVNVLVVTNENTENVVLKKPIRQIACCAQGKKENEFVAFTSKNMEDKKYYCYLFLTKNSKMAIKVLESFKSGFVHALSLTMPPAVCEYCPYKQIQQLCKSLEGVSTQVAQSKIQDCLSTLSEADYSQIMSRYKSSEHADHEYTQIIVLVALLRLHFQKKQEKHTHRGLLPPKLPSKPPPHPASEQDNTTRLTVPALTRAKMAITSSFENLRSKPTADKKQKQDKADTQHIYNHSQSLNIRPTSPLFARKTSIGTLMSPVTTSPMKEGRTRAWTAGVGEIHHQPLLGEETSKSLEVGISLEGSKQNNENPERMKEQGVFITPNRVKKRPKSRGGGGGGGGRIRHSLTPPSVAGGEEHRGHRRSISNIITGSWRQEIFDSVCTPTKLVESGLHRTNSDILEEWQVIEMGAPPGALETASDSPSTRARKRWKHAIKQQILLNYMEKENQRLKKEGKKLKMYYASFEPESNDVVRVWAKLQEQEDPSTKEVHGALLLGVPPSQREEIWEFLSNLYQARNKEEWQYPGELCGREAFRRLSQQSTEYEHSIQIDLSRTFPSQPYFSSGLKEAGQEELHWILHAYAVADQETGYCQGLSFVTGLILMHTKDELSAFRLLYKLMNLHDYKDIYKGSLSTLQIRLYQLSRLMHDFIPTLHQLLHDYEVTPFYYAAPWFLTIFASQYPISFTARVFDLMFYEGTDILFKVALALLKVHETALLKCRSMESICLYLKTRLPEEVSMHEDTILRQALQFHFERKLELFETEYQVMDELNARFNVDIIPVDQDTEKLVACLRRNNSALVEQLAICHGSISSLQQQMESLQQLLLSQQERITRLENSAPSRTS